MRGLHIVVWPVYFFLLHLCSVKVGGDVIDWYSGFFLYSSHVVLSTGIVFLSKHVVWFLFNTPAVSFFFKIPNCCMGYVQCLCNASIFISSFHAQKIKFNQTLRTQLGNKKFRPVTGSNTRAPLKFASPDKPGKHPKTKPVTSAKYTLQWRVNLQHKTKDVTIKVKTMTDTHENQVLHRQEQYP